MSLLFRSAIADDAPRIAALHADSWRRHYRGAYTDAFLDGDVHANRRAVWASRLLDPAGTATVLAEDDAGLAGFAHVIFGDDPRWGSLVDNLHVTPARHRAGIGRRLMARVAQAVLDGADSPAMYLWVLEQNTRAQAFYQAIGGTCVEKSVARSAPEILVGTPGTRRIAWPDATRLLS